MLEKRNLMADFYYPYCREKGCDGILKIKFGDNFNIDYECDKNSGHIGKNIFYKTFERFYLKKEEIKKCINCFSILECDAFYKCTICDKIYCAMCFIKDEHIKKDINNLEIISKKCLLHKRELNQYCEDCKKNYCIYCLKNFEENDLENIHNKNHNIKNLTELMPTKDKIIKLKNKLEKKNKSYEEIINSINQWETTLITKTNQIKQNLKDEINLLTKIIFNFNQYFLNYTYYSTFSLLEDYIKNKKYDIFIKFKNSPNFKEKSKILFEYFDSNKKENKNQIDFKKGYLELFYEINEGIIEKINNKYYFEERMLFIIL